MNDPSAPPKNVRSITLTWSWILVLVCGLTLGYFMLRTFVSPLPRQYRLDFGNAQWIEPDEVSPVAYFRKEIFLTAEPEQAWLEIAATDNYKIIVNGYTLGNEVGLNSRVAGIYDIKRHLRAGKNVIAATSSRISFPGSAQILVYGLIKEPGGRSTPVISDETWRVTTATGVVAGSEEWTSALVPDQLWPNARLAAVGKRHLRTTWVDVNPLLFQLMPLGSWIMSENAASEAIFSTSVIADKARQETWIQVASSGDLDLLVNGHLITNYVPSSPGGKRLPHLPPTKVVPSRNGQSATFSVTAKSTATSTEAPVALIGYDISYWMRKGPNSIVAAVRNDSRPAILFADGFMVRRDGSVRRFQSDASWRTGGPPSGRKLVQGGKVVEVGKYGSAPWGYMPQQSVRPIDRSGFATIAKYGAVILLTIVVTVAVWLLASLFISIARGEPVRFVMVRDALLHGLITIGLLALLLPDFDPRFPYDWSFQPKFVIPTIIVLLGFRFLYVLENKPAINRLRARLAAIRETSLRDLMPYRTLLPYALLAVIMGLGFGLRYHNLGDMSFDHDEMGLVVKSKGIYKLGFPYGEYAGIVRPLTTYEAVPYPLAFSGLIFGFSELSMRLPACLMGTLCIGIIALMGRRLFDWRIGLIAALVYACLPENIRYAQNAFYPQQCQFMAMLTFWLFYEAIRVRPLQRKYLTAAAVTFCVTYLSWEGSGFILPALFVALIVVRWGEWWWLKEFHLYRCVFFMAAVVVAQYCWRTLAGMPYLQVGSGLSNLTGPSIFFLTAAYQPLFYVEKLWLAENHVYFTGTVLAGILFAWGHRGFRYIVTVLVTLFVLHTNFLAALSPRYCYYFQPLLVLAGIAAAVMLYDRLLFLARRAGDSIIARSFAHAAGVALMILLFLQSNDSVIKAYSLSATGDTPGLMTRLGTYRYDYRGAALYVKSHLQPGDLVIPGIPHVYAWYAGKPGDYFLDSLLGSKVPYVQTLSEPVFVDKFAGLPALRNLTELQEVTHRGRRTWVIFAPYSTFEKLNSPDVLDYFDKNSKTVFETYRAKVLLVEGASHPATVATSP